MHWSGTIIGLVLSAVLLYAFSAFCSSRFWKFVTRGVLLFVAVVLVQALMTVSDRMSSLLD